MLKLANLRTFAGLRNSNLLHTTQIQQIDQGWRKANRLPMNPNIDCPLTNLPDFTYMDGRPTPLGQRQKRRVEIHRNIAENIVTGIKEIEFAIDRHKAIQTQEIKMKEEIQESKLKPKGYRLLKKKK